MRVPHLFTALLAECERNGCEVRPYAKAIARRLDADHVPVRWNPRLRVRAGCVRWTHPAAPSVQLNPLLRKQGPQALLATLLHEMAHVIAGPHAGHGRTWRTTALALGDDGGRCHDYAVLLAKKRKTRLVGRCPCGYEVWRVKPFLPGRTYRHRDGCGQEIAHVG